MKILWLPRAKHNRDSQIAYIAERNPQAAVAMGDAIMDAIDRLADHPHVGRPGRIEGTRELVVTGTPYIVAYRVDPAAVVILRLLHGAQQWPNDL